ncbi:hypothetical protein BC833DRAFT_564240 [Globomyces pollinis-pini]|nr:hypothetical protein BC833DRAFT_564240 [Globomyces pollinis-pini]
MLLLRRLIKGLFTSTTVTCLPKLYLLPKAYITAHYHTSNIITDVPVFVARSKSIHLNMELESHFELLCELLCELLHFFMCLSMSTETLSPDFDAIKNAVAEQSLKRCLPSLMLRFPSVTTVFSVVSFKDKPCAWINYFKFIQSVHCIENMSVTYVHLDANDYIYDHQHIQNEMHPELLTFLFLDPAACFLNY